MTPTRAETETLVLGAGLVGAGVALELSARGIPVTLLDQDEVALNRASLRNEGKIHLGLIYANDPRGSTATTQLEGALRFRGLVSRWAGDDSEWMVRSTPFSYLVARDSLLDPSELEAHYERMSDHCRSQLDADASLDYLGERPDGLARRLEAREIAARFSLAHVAAGFLTRELAIDPDRLALRLRQAIDRAPGLSFLPSRRVRSIERSGDGFKVEGDGPMGAWSLRAAQVVNATWERRSALDQQLGISPPTGLLHRLKYRVIATLPDALRGAPSVTMVLGRYGDVVVRPDGTAYLSWYPAGLRGWSQETEPPRDWDGSCRGEGDASVRREIGESILAGIDAWYPGIGGSTPVRIDAGAIVAIGRSDVDDAASGLHDRTRIGVFSCGGYHSVDPGKLTTAPGFAMQAADRVEARRGSAA